MPGSPDAYGLVARTVERARIDAFVDAIRGGTAALLIRGEPGIGKSALWRYAIARSRAAGFRVLVARPSAEDLRLTLAALTELLELAGDDAGALAAEDVLGRGRRTLAAIRSIATGGPVLIAIDDLQWMDPESARALRHAVRRLDMEPVGLVATVRDGLVGDPLETLQALPPGRAAAITIGPLGLEETRGLIRPFVSGISRPVVARIHEISAGNPLYSIELARALPPDRTPDAADIRPPTSVQAAIAARVGALPPDVIHALEVVAVLGPSTQRGLGEALGTEEVGLLLAPAKAADVLSLEDERVRFAHPLIESVVYASMDPEERRALHGRMATRSGDPETRARHLVYSTEEADEAVAAELETASDRASARNDFHLAAEFAAHAARLTPNHDEERLIRRRLAEIEARIGAGQNARALTLADGLAASLPRGPARARVIVSRSYAEDEDRHTAERRLLEALEDTADDEGLRGMVLERLVDAGRRGDAESIARLEEATDIARRHGDQGLTIRAMAMLARTRAMAGTPRLDLNAEVIRLYEDGDRDPIATDPRNLFAKELVWSGELREARSILDTVWAELGGVGSELQRMQALYDLALLELAAGAFDEASSLGSRGREMAIDSEDSFALAKFDGVAAAIAVWRGEVERALALIERLIERERKDLDISVRSRWLRGLLALSREEPRLALSDLEVAFELHERVGILHPGMIPVLPDAVEAAAAAGETERARELSGLLQERVPRIGTPWSIAIGARAAATVMLSDGLADQAVAPLREAVSGFDATGHRPQAARTSLTLGRALLRAGQRTAAADALDDARGRFESLGARLWLTQCLSELERTAPGRAKRALTPTERRIAELVASGARNKEIAAALFVSTANVEAHLTRIFRKLDLRSRADLVRWMSTQEGANTSSPPSG